MILNHDPHVCVYVLTAALVSKLRIVVIYTYIYMQINTCMNKYIHVF
jgi:hypothetical protein